ncbi:hypothetical protein [Glycomyces sambucus]|nr:hypothetical protein [Glycomyces sambucus]
MNGETGLHEGKATDASTSVPRVPDRMTFCRFWATDDHVNVEVYVDPQLGDGYILLFSEDDRTSGEVSDANDRFEVNWSGDLGRPKTWLNAQRVRAAHVYTERRR